MWVLWPAFLLACVTEFAVFALLDPSDLRWDGETLPLTREAIYTLAFFMFWGLAATSSGLTALLAISAREVNQQPR